MLNAHVEVSPEDALIRDSIVRLYGAVRAQDWATVYSLMIGSYRDRIDRDSFVRVARKERPHLSGYEVLASGIYRLGPDDIRRRFIIRFEQGGHSSYEVVWWRIENGVWRAENIGIPGFSLDGIGDVTF